ncbi:hypothetical protein [Sulfurospirillum cavolei]|uniref:hypothetical protein n=1 Tax=Sulfurospirillum cavolei TaxID=366522 RepID=UPI0007649187|nr:hypothetical protein [Sulfurospirillum cavolei]
MKLFRDLKLLEIVMLAKLNSAFLLCLFSISTSLCADNDTRLDYTLDMLKKEFPTIQCNQQTLLSPYEGHYVEKDFWIKLEKTKNYALSANKESDLLIVNIGKDGLISVSENYHEGQNYDCSFEQKSVLWSCEYTYKCIKLQVDSQKQLFISEFMYEPKKIASLPNEIPMVGSLIRVGTSYDESVYFEKIFQHKCYTSEVGEKWCFGKDEISIDNKVHKVYLELDIIFTPKYGNALAFDDQLSGDLFVFVPYKNGWKIFQDSWIDSENHVEVNPLTDKPWRILQE